MNDDELEERMRQAISAGPLEPTPSVWESITNSRRPRRLTRSLRLAVLAGTGVAAAAAFLLVMLPRPFAPVPDPEAQSAATVSDEEVFFAPAALQAQTHPAFPLLGDDPIGLRLRPGTWAYMVQRGTDSIGSYTYSTERTELNGLPAWLIVDGKGPPTKDRRGSDSLWTTADSMRPLFRVSLLPSGRREQTFRSEDVLIGFTQNEYTTWRTVPLRDSTRTHTGAVIRWNESAVMLQTTRLGPDWKGSIPLAGSGEYGAITPVWFNFEVVGSESVTVPAGTFECWRIRLGMSSEIDSLIKGERPGMTLWVSKDRQWLVQETIVVPGKANWKHVLTFGKEE